MTISWKYYEPVEVGSIINIEKKLSKKFPQDYKKLLSKCNAAKPLPCQFDIHERKGCLVDYMLNINENSSNSLLKIAENLYNNGFDNTLVPIATDPFGNIIAFNYSTSQDNPDIIFWDHESNKITFISRSFSMFISMLY